MFNHVGCLLAIMLSFCLAGCGATYKEFTIDGVTPTSLSLDARQRVILVTDKGGPTGARRVVCAEPSPDVFAALVASGQISFGVKGIADAGAASTRLAETVATIARRTATTQLLRDGLYRACEAYMNGVIGQGEYRQIIMAYDEILITLVALEGLGRPNVESVQMIGSQVEKDSHAGQQDNAQKRSNPKTSPPPTQADAPSATNSTPLAKQQVDAVTPKPQTTKQENPRDNAVITATLEEYAAKNIHQIVRDYYCFQLALKSLFFAGQTREGAHGKQPVADAGQDEALERYGKLPAKALNTLCAGSSDQPASAAPKSK